ARAGEPAGKRGHARQRTRMGPMGPPVPLANHPNWPRSRSRGGLILRYKRGPETARLALLCTIVYTAGIIMHVTGEAQAAAPERDGLEAGE
ncbi:MAG: hypothetical protein WAO08_12085, partial [Hyphomicrobiaceae bacterium]